MCVCVCVHCKYCTYCVCLHAVALLLPTKARHLWGLATACEVAATCVDIVPLTTYTLHLPGHLSTCSSQAVYNLLCKDCIPVRPDIAINCMEVAHVSIKLFWWCCAVHCMLCTLEHDLHKSAEVEGQTTQAQPRRCLQAECGIIGFFDLQQDLSMDRPCSVDLANKG